MTGYVENAWRDLDLAEEKQRDELERKYKDTLDVLIQLAHALRGEAMEAARSKDPLAPFNWGRFEWNEFWFRDNGIINEDTAAAWGKQDVEAVRNDPTVLGMPKINMLDVFRTWQDAKQVEIQKKRFANAVEAHRNEISRKNQQIAKLTKRINQIEILLASAKSQDKRFEVEVNTHKEANQRISLPVLQTPTINSVNYMSGGMFKKELSLWQNTPATDKLPDAWQKNYRATQSSARIYKNFQILFAIYSAGISCRHKIDWLLAAISGISSKNGNAKRSYHDMHTEGIIIEKQFSMQESDFPTNITYCSLTEKGQRLCNDWGLAETDNLSEFEQVKLLGADLESPTIQLALTFSFYAKLRKWESHYQDKGNYLQLLKGKESYEIIIVPHQVSDTEIQKRIDKMQASGMKFGIVAISPERGAKIVEWCKQKQIAAAYTDIFHLVNKKPDSKKIVTFTFDDYAGSLPLWVEQWD